MLKAGLIGCGSMGGGHLGNYYRFNREGDLLRLTCVCDIRRERLDTVSQETGEIRLYEDLDEMLANEELDLVTIALPTYLHKWATIKCLERGIHVLCEKPMALTVEDCDEMIAAAKAADRQLLIGQVLRFEGEYQYLKKLVDEKTYGDVVSVRFTRSSSAHPPMGWNNWFRDGALSGGCTLDLHIHDVDMISYLFGMPKSVTAVAGTAMSKNGYDYVSAQDMYGKGFYAHSMCDWSTSSMKANTRTIRICFEHGYFYIDRTAGRQMCVRVNEDGTVVELTNLITEVGDMYYNEAKYFANCVENDLVPEKALPETCIDSVKLVMAEIESADNDGELVRM